MKKMSSRPLTRSIEKACLVPAASAVVGHYSGTHAAASGREAAYSNDLHATLAPGGSPGIDGHSASSHSHHLNAMNGKDSAAAKPKPGIVVIHGRAVFRDCFVRCLEISYKDHEIFSFANVAEWSCSQEPSALAAAVVIAVIDSSDEFNVTAAEFLESAAANVPVVIVSDVDDLDHIVRTLKSGARGYIPTSLPFNIAVEAVRLVKAGGTFVPASSFVHDRNGQPTAMKTSALLTERQMKVVEEIRHGKANKQIAYELNMSEHTVKVHLRHIMRKLKAKNRTEVAVMSNDLLAGSRDLRREILDLGPNKDLEAI
jgi:DNA-binding NarL/FixJ family response regulator